MLSAKEAYKHPGERVWFSFDFAGYLAEGETLAATEVTVAVRLGTDPNAAQLLSGLPVIDEPEVKQFLVGGVDGAVYRLQCKADTSEGQTFILQEDLAVTTNIVE